MIAIEGMSMPRDCFSCPFAGGTFGICKNGNYRVHGNQQTGCPLREVGKLAASQIVNQEYSEGITWAKDEATRKIAEKLRGDGCIIFEVTSAMEDYPAHLLFYDPCHPGEVKVRALLTVVMPEGVKK